MTRLKEIFREIDGYWEEVIRLQKALTSLPALGPENGGSGEHEKVRFTKGLLEEMNPDYLEVIKAPDGRAQNGYRPNLVARWGDSLENPAVWVLTHSDVVPPGDISLWESDPYEIRVEGDRIIGRGVEDNQHGFISSYIALKVLLGLHPEIKNPICLAIVADEETGSQYGLKFLLEHRRDLFSENDMILVPDAGNKEGTMIEVAEKSIFWAKFTVTGQQCHASSPHKGKNSLLAAARLIIALQELKELFNLEDDLFAPPTSTFEATKMENNVLNINTIPGRDIFYMDCRILPHYEVDDVLTECRRISEIISEEMDVKIQVDTVHRENSAESTSTDAPVVRALVKAIREVTGKEAGPMGIGGGTVAAFFRKAGLQAAVWSTVSDSAHQPNEY